MKITKTFSRTMLPMVAVFAMLVSLILPVVTSAAPITGRSIALSDARRGETATYTVTFTAPQSAGAFVLDFCEGPIIGTDCGTAGVGTSGADSESAGITNVTPIASNTKLVVAGTIENTVTAEITGITNPSNRGTIYARIITYDTEQNALLYESQDLKDGSVDTGSVAIAITDPVRVSGTVLETLLFCVSGGEIAANCTGLEEPVLALGEQTGETVSLVPGQLSDGDLYTQITTNAVNGAVVHLKSSAVDCGGLVRNGGDDCIEPAQDQGINVANNDARFGVRAISLGATDGVANTTGEFLPVASSFYNDTTYALNFATGNATGVTSTFGDPFLDTRNAPVNNMNVGLNFGVAANNNTPAGTYSADLSLIATGRF